jgi:hypothetical protein
MIENTLNLGIAILRGGNLEAQTVSWAQCYKTYFVLNLRIFVIS